MDLDKWSIFSLLSAEFVRSIRLAYVFGSQGKNALVVTVDDDVYGWGSNWYGCVGLGDVGDTFKPRKIESLCQKKIKTISHTQEHLLAVTETGLLYDCRYNQLGNKNKYHGLPSIQVTTNSLGKKVINVSCGINHSLALTNEGEVFALNDNDCDKVDKSGSTTNQLIPRKVTACIGKRRVIVIACGDCWSMAVLNNGELYGWGKNGQGQCGLGNNVYQFTPCRVVNLQNVFIKQVVCGCDYTMALSDRGVVYAWGSNSYGQLGTGNKDNLIVPQIIAPEMGRVVEIATSLHNCTSAAMTQTSKVYMWGCCQGVSVLTPKETPFHSMNKVFARCASTAVTWKPMLLDVPVTRVVVSQGVEHRKTQNSQEKHFIQPVNEQGPLRRETGAKDAGAVAVPRASNSPAGASSPQMSHSLLPRLALTPGPVEGQGLVHPHSDSLRIAFDDPQTSDVKFFVEGKFIHVHKSVLKIRCEHLRSMFQHHWEKNGKDVVEIDEYSYPVYRAFLQYLYTDTVKVPPEKAIGLFVLANCYQEQQLKCHCERIIKEGITVNNVTTTYTAAIKHSATKFVELCFSFIPNIITAVIHAFLVWIVMIIFWKLFD